MDDVDLRDILLPPGYDKERNRPLMIHTVTFINDGFTARISWCNYEVRYRTWIDAANIARKKASLSWEWKFEFYGARLA